MAVRQNDDMPVQCRVALRIAAMTGLMCAVLLLFQSTPLGAQPKEPAARTYFRIATGPVSGTYFAVGAAMARVLSRPVGAGACRPGARCGVTGLSAAATATDGSLANIRLLVSGLTESALAQSDIVAAAYAGKNMFNALGPREDLRVIANLYPESLHLVVARSANIDTARDLRGKRVGIDRPRSGTNGDARRVLKAFGLQSGALTLLEIPPDQSAAQLLAGEIDAFFFLGGAPVPLIADLVERGAATLLPLTGSQVHRLLGREPDLRPISIAAETYQGLGEIETVGVDALWVTTTAVSEDLVYRMSRALFNAGNRSALLAAHPVAAMITAASAVRDLPIPLHDGAKRFYTEVGALALEPGAPPPAPSVPAPRIRPDKTAPQAAIR